MSELFGLIVSGRPVYTTATTVSPTQLAFQIPSSPPFNHLVVFLLPGATIPEGQVAAVYIQLPPSTEFQLLGAVSGSKPSAIFRTRDVSASSVGNVDDDAMVDESAGAVGAGSGDVVVGISLEPVAQVEQALEKLRVEGTSSTSQAVGKRGNAQPVSTKVLAQRIIGNAFNFLASFGSDVIPLKAFEEWWKKFERRVEMDPTFLEREVTS